MVDEVEQMAGQREPYHGRFRGVWRLPAFDHSASSGLDCSGRDVANHDEPNRRQGQPVEVVIDLSLPANPPSPPEKTSMSIRAITLTAPGRGR